MEKSKLGTQNQPKLPNIIHKKFEQNPIMLILDTQSIYPKKRKIVDYIMKNGAVTLADNNIF